MNLGELGKNILNNKEVNNLLSDFIKELTEALNKNEEKSNTNSIEEFEKKLNQVKKNRQEINNSKEISENDICVVYGMKDNKLTLINIENGKEFDIYLTTSQEDRKELEEKDINNICQMNKNDFYNIDLGSKLIVKNNKFEIYNGELNIKDQEAFNKLDEMYSAIKEDENKNFIVTEITDEKIYLTYENGEGNISIYKELYPELKIGDIVKKQEGKYIKN